jgi:hypothetical protein
MDMRKDLYNQNKNRNVGDFLLATAFLAACLLLSTAKHSHGETLSLSTFYPSPFGVYNMLRLVPRDVGFIPPCAGTDGLLWINSTGELRLCWGGVETAPPQVWEQNETTDKVYLTEFATNPALQVGIGTSTPLTTLQVNDTVVPVMRLDSSSGTEVGLEFYQRANRRGGLRANATNAFSVTDNAVVPNERVVVSQAGNMGIGIAVPASPLHTANHITTTGFYYSGTPDASAGNFLIYGGGAGNPEGGQINLELPANHDITFQYWDLEVLQDHLRIRNDSGGTPTSMMIDGAGRVTFGPTPIAGNELAVNGNMIISTTGAVGGTGQVWAHFYQYPSDENLKENIRPVKGLDIITRLKGVRYHLKGTDKDGIGLIAQDVEKVVPELVETVAGTNLKGIQYENLIAPMIEALKEQQAQIDALQREITEFESKQF